jgi:uncharacterized membrane protein (DUF373 family)
MNEELESNSEAKELSERDERFVAMLQRLIHYAVRVLAVLMVIVIWFGVADVLYVLITRISAHPFYLIDISDILATFGAFMAVLIAIEIFINIVSYLREDAIQLEIVLATAYMAILRKVIVLDYKETPAEYVYATAAVVLAVSVGYWLIVLQKRFSKKPATATTRNG